MRYNRPLASAGGFLEDLRGSQKLSRICLAGQVELLRRSGVLVSKFVSGQHLLKMFKELLVNSFSHLLPVVLYFGM